MRFVKISQKELDSARKLYENVMSYACHGLFLREGMVVGEQIAAIAKKNPQEFFETVKRILVGRGWVENITFEPDRAITKGAIEVSPGNGSKTCHRMRGVLTKIYESYRMEKVKCFEDECESEGNSNCIFIIEPED